MLSERTRSLVSWYWADYLGLSAEALFATARQIMTHGAELADYAGIFALFRHDRVIISLPRDRAEPIRALLPAGSLTAENLAAALRDVSSAVVGPAYIGYTDSAPALIHAARNLVASDSKAIGELRSACDPIEWEHGGCGPKSCAASGVFVGDQLVALAGYETWGGSIAHISVITHPDWRGRRYGRSAVADLVRRALSAGLIPQYRTLMSNVASIHVADALGFCQFATSVSIRLTHASPSHETCT
jgi:GNAT superfamily N-acetyltransferase